MNTPIYSKAQKSEDIRLLYALSLGEDDRACAITAGLTKPGWLAFKWEPPATLKKNACYCVRGPDGKRYSSIREARDAHDGIVHVDVECQRLVGEGDEAHICGKVKRARPGSIIGCPKCPSGELGKSITPNAEAIAAGQLKGKNDNLKWKVVTLTDEVDQSNVGGRYSWASKTTELQLTTEEAAGFDDYVADLYLDQTILSVENLKIRHEIRVLEERRSKFKTDSESYKKVGISVRKLKQKELLMTTTELMAAFESAKTRHPEKARELQILLDCIQSKTPLPSNHRFLSSRTKECADKCSQYKNESNDHLVNRWKRKQNTSAANDCVDLAIDVLDNDGLDDQKLVNTIQVFAEIEYRNDPNYVLQQRRRANNIINGKTVEAHVTEAVEEASASLYLSETDESCQVVTDIKKAFFGGMEDGLSYKEIASNIRAAAAGARARAKSESL